MNKEEIVESLATITLLFDEPLMNYTFTKTGGPADVLAFPKKQEEVKQIIDYCRIHDIPWKQIHVKGTMVIAEAGASLIDTTYAALAESLTGFEFACGIPGSVGGAVYMNAGAYGGEIKDVFAEVDLLLEDGTLKTLTKDEMVFSYRHSKVQELRAIVLEARFSLQTGDYEAIKARMDELTELRQSKQPLEYPSCGSVFKRPVGHYTGQLIQQAGLQGLKWGGAQVSEKHAGFIVNIDHATATDYIELIAHIQEVIKEKFDVSLETEVRIIGEKQAISETSRSLAN